MSEPTPDTAAAPPTAFAYAGFNKLLSAAFLGALADRLYQTLMMATTSVIFLKESSNQQNGRVQIFSIVPMLILYGFVGSVVDSVDRRKLLAGIKALKFFLVLGFAALLWNVGTPGDFPKTNSLPWQWNWGLILVLIMNIVSVPFSPARAAIVPDVLPPERRSMGASLIATAGLCTYLMGSFGMSLASPSMLGPARMALIASGLYAASMLLFWSLPAAAGVPGNQRHGEPEKSDDGAATAPPRKMTLAEHAHELYDGLRYCVRRPALFALIIFESVFWTVASMLLLLLLFYASDVLGVSGDGKNFFMSNALVSAGLGLFLGALGVGKLAPKMSPVFSYVPAYALIAFGLMVVFNQPPVITVVNGIEVHHAAAAFYPLLFLLALGGGALLGRVDADVLAISDERYRGRIFSIKAVAFAVCSLLTMLYLNEGASSAMKFTLIRVVPQVMFWTLPVVFVLAWLVDVAIWAHRTDIEAPNWRRRIQWRCAQALAWILVKVLFRFSTRGLENVPKTGPVILASNHGSFLDPILLGSASPRVVQYLMYTSFYTSVAHPVFRFLSCIPVDEKRNLAALKTGVASLNKGVCIGIFPEGQVAYEKKLYPPQGGALFLAQRSGASVVPVAIQGDWDVLPRWKRFPSFKKITVVFGKPFVVGKDLTKQQTADLAQNLMAQIAGMLGVPPPEPPAPKAEAV